jgi:hypothetical protein
MDDYVAHFKKLNGITMCIATRKDFSEFYPSEYTLIYRDYWSVAMTDSRARLNPSYVDPNIIPWVEKQWSKHIAELIVK